MPEISNEKIAILCAIGEGKEVAPAQLQDIVVLLAEGLVERAGDGASTKFKLTAKAEQFIAERGAGLNEA